MHLTRLARVILAAVVVTTVALTGWRYYGERPVPRAVPAKKTVVPLSIGVLDPAGALPGILANDGLTAGPHSRFKAAGVDVQFVLDKSLNEQLAAFDKNVSNILLLSLDAFANLEPNYHDKNIELRAFFMTGWSRGNLGIVASTKIKSVEDLRQARIATHRNLPPHFLLLEMLRDSNLPPADIARIRKNLVFATSLPFAAQMFQRGEVDAVATSSPTCRRRWPAAAATY
jgi:ABC-type amino acid transport substrate-binding protein